MAIDDPKDYSLSHEMKILSRLQEKVNLISQYDDDASPIVRKYRSGQKMRRVTRLAEKAGSLAEPFLRQMLPLVNFDSMCRDREEQSFEASVTEMGDHDDALYD